MTIKGVFDQIIADKVKFEEYQKKRRELMKRRKTEGKKYKLQVDYHIRMNEYDREFNVEALNMDDALDQIYDELASDHNVDQSDIDVDAPEVVSEGEAQPPKPISCPACGSADIEANDGQDTISVPYGPAVAYTKTIHHCHACRTVGDFTGDNDAKIKFAQAKSQGESAKFMIEQLTTSPNVYQPVLTPSYVERALRVQSGSTKLWKMGMISDTALSLLRIVYTFPWLLQVSDASFNPEIARIICLAYLKRLNETAPNCPFPIHHSQEANTAAADDGDK
jgi:ribosomal protein L20A (L18A)